MRRECLHSVWVSAQCAASLPVSLRDCYKRISDVDAESEGKAARTKRMLYHCGVQSQWVLFYAKSLHKFYSKTYRCACTLGERKEQENDNNQDRSWDVINAKCVAEFVLQTGRFFFILNNSQSS